MCSNICQQAKWFYYLAAKWSAREVFAFGESVGSTPQVFSLLSLEPRSLVVPFFFRSFSGVTPSAQYTNIGNR
jgi:hypothetical protein